MKPATTMKPTTMMKPTTTATSAAMLNATVQVDGFDGTAVAALGRASVKGGPGLAGVAASLEQGARRENLRHALSALVHMGGAVGKAAQAVIDSGVALNAPASHDIDGLRHVVKDAISAVAGDVVGNAAFARLKGALTAFRAGAERPVIFAVEPVVFPSPLPAAPKLKASVGFDAAVAGMRFDEGHSIDDLQHYVDQRFGRFALTDLVENQRPIELHHGRREEAIASLSSRGFTQAVRVRTPEAVLHNELYLFENPQTGELRYVVTEIWGGTRLGHLQKLLKAAEVQTSRGVEGVSSSQVELHTEDLRRPEEIYRRTSRALLASGTVPASVVVGFKASILKELGRRAAAAKGLEYVRQSLGADPVATLRARAHADIAAGGVGGEALLRTINALGDDASVLALEPAEVFRFAARLDKLSAVESALSSLSKTSKEAAALTDDVVSAHGFKVKVHGRVADRIPEGAFIDQTMLSYVDADGAQRNLLLTRNPYGEIAHELGRVLVDHGVDNVFVFGTAGGLNADDDAIGDVHLPKEVIHRSGLLRFDNRAIEIATQIPALLRPQSAVGGRVVNVASPVDETTAGLAALKNSGADIVEMELSHLAHALRGTDVKLSAVYMVSDVPGTDKTIEKQGHNELERSLQQAVDVLVEGLHMRSVVLETDAKRPEKAPFAGAMALAERALQQRGIVGESYGLLRYVVARYLMNGLSDAAISSLCRDDKASPIDCAQLSPRWKEKALRELQTPYKNEDVIAHLRGLNAELKRAVLEMRRLGATPANLSVHILGSVVKGRAGKGSDVDTLISTSDTALADRIYKSPYGYLGAPAVRNVVVGGLDYAMSRGDHYGPIVKLGDGQGIIDDDDALVAIWAKAAADFGVKLEKDDAGAYVVHIDDDALEGAVVTRDTDPVAERLLEHEKTFRKSVETDFLLKHLNDLAPIADITAVPLERMVHAGELLLRTRLVESLTVKALVDVIESPLGAQKLRAPAGQAFLQQAGLTDANALVATLRRDGLGTLPLATLIDGELAAALMDVGDPYDALTVDLAAAQRVKSAHERHVAAGGVWAKPEHFPFFEREVKAARQREKRFSNAVSLQAHVRSSS